jgi:hypothetical protein
MRYSVLIAVCAAGIFAVPTASATDPPPPPGGPGISQYVETVPSGSGGKAVGVGQWQKVTLSKKVQKKLKRRGTPVTSKLRSVAESSLYGAPQQTLSRPDKTKRSTPSSKPIGKSASRATNDGNVFSAAASAATDSGSRTPLILLAAIVLLTTVAGVLAAAKRSGQAR